MRIEFTDGNKWLTSFGLNIITPVLIAMGAVVVIALATPVMMVVAVVAISIALLMASTVVTRQIPVEVKHRDRY